MTNMNFTETDNASYFDGNSFNVFYDYTMQLDWLIAILLNVFFMTSTAWILVSLVHFGIKTGKWKQIQRNNEEKLNAVLFILLWSAVQLLVSFITFSATST